ncbi:MAG: phosphorylase [Deltaproteobacteria bacterium]|nr:phosphorylase [Deltaproteobacteria bacterium]TLN02124.1 MAG: phosphorylase [bacterium]
MKQERIGIVMAMQEEIRPVLRRLGRHRKERAGQFPLYLFQRDGRQLFLIESGMGTKRASAATEELISRAQPRLIITAGLGGAVRPGLNVGDLVLAGQVLALGEGLTTEIAGIANEALLRVVHESVPGQPFRIVDGTTVTTSVIVNKKLADQQLARDIVNPVLDMETSAVAEIAERKGIPLVAVRAVSDAADEELLFSLDELTDRELNIRIGKVLFTVAKKPRILPQLIRLAKNSKLAANNLAIILEQLTHLV